MRTKLCVFLAGAAVSMNVKAAGVIFDLRDESNVLSIEAGVYVVDGVQLNLSSSQGSLNQTASGFGVNHSLSGDDTDQIDGVAGAETLLFSFDTSGILGNLALSQFGASDTFELKKGAVTILSLTDQGNSSPDIFNVNESFTSGDTFSLIYTGGNGASFDSISITAVPEPSSTLLLGMGGLTVLFRRKRKHHIRSLPND